MPPFPTPADPALADFVLVHFPGARALVRRGYEAYGALLGVVGDPPAGGATVPGRAPHPVVELPAGERVVVRRYHRGGLMSRVNPDRYFRGSRAFEELRATERARLAGVRVPVVIAAVHRAATFGYRATLATRLVEGAIPLVEWLAGPGRPAESALRAAGREIAAMHDAGIDHPDLNLRNLLVDGDGAVYLLDFDRARVLPRPAGEAARTRNLLRLARSARKLRAPIDAAGWSAFRAGYGGGWPVALPLGDPPASVPPSTTPR